jgi:hypothetical protein
MSFSKLEFQNFKLRKRMATVLICVAIGTTVSCLAVSSYVNMGGVFVGLLGYTGSLIYLCARLWGKSNAGFFASNVSQTDSKGRKLTGDISASIVYGQSIAIHAYYFYLAVGAAR